MKFSLYRTVAFSFAFVGAASLAQAQFGQDESSQDESPQAQQRELPGGALQQESPEKNAVAIVNDEPITETEYQSALEAQMKQVGQADPNTLQQLRGQVMKSLVESRLVEQHLLSEGPKVADEEVEEVIDRYKEQFKQQGVPFDRFLADSGYTQSGLEKRIKGSLAWQKYQEEEVTEEDLQEHFAENQDRFPVDDFEQAKPLVAQSYAGELWAEIVKKEEPKAEIKIVQSEQQQAEPQSPNDGGAIPQP